MYGYIVLQFSGTLKCSAYPEWFEPFVRDWIDEIARKVKGEIVLLFDNEDLETSIKVQMILLFLHFCLILCAIYHSPTKIKNVQL